MKDFWKEIQTKRIVAITLIGCLLFLGGIIFFRYNHQNALNRPHPSGLTKKVLYSPEPITVPSFREPSLEGLVAKLKEEIGDVSDTVDPETTTGERFLDIANHMDDRRTPTEVDAAWRERKRKVIANPDLLWQPGFVLPPYLDMQDERHKVYLFDYEVKHGFFKETKSQEKRLDALRDTAQKGEITDEEYRRKSIEIIAEGKDPLTVAKYLSNQGVGYAKLGIEYAERALKKAPDSFEALHVWALCHETREQREAGFRRLVNKFPNSGIAHWELAIELIFSSPHNATSSSSEALEHMQRAIQLDSRIPPNNAMLALCYKALGEHEKALAVYQGMRAVHRANIGDLYGVQTPIYEKRMQNEQK